MVKKTHMNTREKHFYLRNNSYLLKNDNLTERSKQSIVMAKANNTIDAYESDWNDFVDWCTYKKVSYFPATPETVVNYINDLARFAKANTIARRISALSENYTAAPHVENPCRDPMVRQAMRGIRRMLGTFQQGKTPILLEDIQDIVDAMQNDTSLTWLRDKSILLLGFMGAFRRSEIAALTVENIRFSPNGMEIFVKSSKVDQEGQGTTVAIPFIPQRQYCAVTALQTWLHHSGIQTGPLYRGFRKNGDLRTNALSDKSIADIVKKYVTLIGLDPAMYGAHSLRHGFATTAALHGVEERNIMRQTRHHSVNMVRRYINEANAFVDNPISTIFGKLK